MPIETSMRVGIAVRRAAAADAAVIVRSQLRMARETEALALDPATVARGVRAALADPRRGVYYVAERSGRFAGCLLVTREWSDWRDGWIWWIQSLFVAPAHRRHGVCAALFRQVAARARRTGTVRALRLYVASDNAAAQRTYTVLGMDGGHYLVYERPMQTERPERRRGERGA